MDSCLVVFILAGLWTLYGLGRLYYSLFPREQGYPLVVKSGVGMALATASLLLLFAGSNIGVKKCETQVACGPRINRVG